MDLDDDELKATRILNGTDKSRNNIIKFKSKTDDLLEFVDELKEQNLTHYNLSDEFESYKFKSSIMQKVKNELIENGYVIKSIRGIGYYILKQNQIQSYTYRTYIKKPLRHLKKAEIILNNTKTSLLNKKELEKHQLTNKLNKDLINITETLINAKEYEQIKK